MFKFISIEGITITDKTTSLFRDLTKEEKDFIREDKGLQENQTGEEFAVKTKYYGSLLVYDSD